MGAKIGIVASCLALLACFGCKKEEPPRERLEVAADHRACAEGEACGVVETSCRTEDCECGVAVNEAFLIDYQRQLAECRGQAELAVCDFTCETPFAKCFEGACVLTSEPPELFRRGRSVQALCESTRGTYVGCPECPPNERCKSCLPCECPSSHRWTAKGCSAVVKAEARDIHIETRPSRITVSDAVKLRVTNQTGRTIWLKTACGTPFYRLRKKEDEWEVGYEAFQSKKCRLGSIQIKPGEKRPFVVKNMGDFRAPSGGTLSPGTYRFEVTYTDRTESFRHSGTVYSAQLDLITQISRR